MSHRGGRTAPRRPAYRRADVRRRRGKFAIEGLGARALARGRCRAKATTQPSALSWRGGAIFGLAIGAADLQFSSSARQFRCCSRRRIPLLDGALALESFRVRNAGLPSVAFMVDATLEPINVKRVCRAFGWPEFGGRVGGVISKLRMREGVVTLGTTLRAQVFDGKVMISDLRLEQPLGQWPRLYSNVALDNLDLELDDERVLVRAHHRPAVGSRRRLAAVQLGAGRVRCAALHAAGRSFETSHQSARRREHRQHRRRRCRRHRSAVERIPALLRRFQLRAPRDVLSAGERRLRDGRRRAGAERRLLPGEGSGPAAHRRHRQLATRRLAAAGAAADRGHGVGGPIVQ